MKLALWSPRNDLSGQRKLVTMVARELGLRHTVRMLYPVIPDQAFIAHLRQPWSWWRRLKTALGDVGRYARHPAWRYASLLTEGRVSVETYWQTLPVGTLESVDAIVYFSPYQAMELSTLPAMRAKRVFYAMHDQTRTEAHLIERTCLQRAYQMADHVVALSEETQQHLSELGVACEAILPAGVDTACFHPNGSFASQPLSLLGYYWPGEPRKGASVLLSALERLRSRHHELVVGLLTSPGIQVSGYSTYSDLTEEDLAALYRRFAIFIYPSTHGGGFALPPLEAMASGCGVVAAPVGAIGEYLRHGISGLLCDTRNVDQLVTEIERLIQQPDLLARIRQQAVLDAQAWSWPRAAERLEQYLQTIVEPPSCRH